MDSSHKKKSINWKKGFSRNIITVAAALLYASMACSSWAADESREFRLYLPTKKKQYLVETTDKAIVSNNRTDQVRSVLNLLVSTPGFSGEANLLSGISVSQCFIDRDDIVFIDITPVSGIISATIHEERLLIWSFVNTLFANFPETGGVKILIGGREAATFAGHIDISRPLKADGRLGGVN